MSSSDPHVFDPLADAYKKYRPSYPEILLQELNRPGIAGGSNSRVKHE
jgi:hypothetical protein